MEIDYSMRYCDFDAAMMYIDNAIGDLIREVFSDMPRNEWETVKGFAFRDFIHYLATRIGLYSRKTFSETTARRVLCHYVERMGPALLGKVAEWFQLWKVKWNQRVRLVFSEEEFKKASQSVKWSSDLERVIKSINIDHLRLFVISNLVRNGEVAGLEQIAEYLIRDVLNASLERYGVDKTLEMYKSGAVAARLLEKIRELKTKQEPLLLLKFDFGRL